MNDLMRISGFMLFVGGLVKIALNLLDGSSLSDQLILLLVTCFGLNLLMLGYAVMRIDELHNEVEKAIKEISKLQTDVRTQNASQRSAELDSLG